jgi:hypothetical protein
MGNFNWHNGQQLKTLNNEDRQAGNQDVSKVVGEDVVR